MIVADFRYKHKELCPLLCPEMDSVSISGHYIFTKLLIFNQITFWHGFCFFQSIDRLNTI